MTGLWAFETQLPYQKYQGPPIVVRCTFGLVQSYDQNKIEYQRSKTVYLDTIFASFIHVVQMLPKIVKENIHDF